jgi:hypothetical protein
MATPGHSRTRLDRVDAILEIFARATVPVAGAFLNGAHSLVGYVVRDADRLEGIMRALPEREAVGRRSLVVALGLLGRFMPLEIALRDPSDPHDVGACLLGAVVSDLDPRRAGERVAAIDAAAKDGARRLTNWALARVEAGHLLSVIG